MSNSLDDSKKSVPSSKDSQVRNSEAQSPQSKNRPVEQEIAKPAEIIEEINSLPEEQREDIIEHFATTYSGPIPHPEMMEHYGRILPDAPHRILTMAEKEQEHRIQMQQNELSGLLSTTKRAQFLAFVLILVIVLSGVYLVSIGKVLVGSLFTGVGIGSVLLAFFKSHSLLDNNRDEKNTD